MEDGLDNCGVYGSQRLDGIDCSGKKQLSPARMIL
jgi:hypothetical protein